MMYDDDNLNGRHKPISKRGEQGNHDLHAIFEAYLKQLRGRKRHDWEHAPAQSLQQGTDWVIGWTYYRNWKNNPDDIVIFGAVNEDTYDPKDCVILGWQTAKVVVDTWVICGYKFGAIIMNGRMKPAKDLPLCCRS